MQAHPTRDSSSRVAEVANLEKLLGDKKK